MYQQPDEHEPSNEPPALQPEFCGGGPGGRFRTAVGLPDDGMGVDPTVLTKDPPVWFPLVRSHLHQHYYSCLTEMPKERALQILHAVGIPPLCILAVGIRWQLLSRDDFDYLDLQAVFQTAGHDVSTFGRTLDKLEVRSLYHLYRMLGTRNKDMLQNADISEFTTKHVLP